MRARTWRRLLVTALAAVLPASCGGPHNAALPAAYSADTQSVLAHGTRSPIGHVIIVVQQSRTLVNLFAGFPGADAPTVGRMKNSGGNGYTYTPLKPVSLSRGKGCQIDQNFARSFVTAYDSGAMDGFNELDRDHPLCAYTYVNPKSIA